jgi:hypothetical protein
MSKAFRSARTGHADLKLLTRWEKRQARQRDEMSDTKTERLEADNARLRAALQTLLLNYGAALPEGQKDTRSIRQARAALKQAAAG